MAAAMKLITNESFIKTLMFVFFLRKGTTAGF